MTDRRRDQIVTYLGVTAAYLRICEERGDEPQLYHGAFPTDIPRYVQELGGVDAALLAVFHPDVPSPKARAWFRIVAGEAAA